MDQENNFKKMKNILDIFKTMFVQVIYYQKVKEHFRMIKERLKDFLKMDFFKESANLNTKMEVCTKEIL